MQPSLSIGCFASWINSFQVSATRAKIPPLFLMVMGPVHVSMSATSNVALKVMRLCKHSSSSSCSSLIVVLISNSLVLMKICLVIRW